MSPDAPGPHQPAAPSGRVEAAPSGRVEAAQQRLEIVAPGYLALVRRASLRLAHRDGSPVDVVTALADVQDTAGLDIEAPTLSRLRIGRWVKISVRKLVGWYLRYLTQQVNAFTNAVTRFATVLVDRTDRLEEATAAVAADLERLRRRVEHLEQAGPTPPAHDGEEPA